MSREVTPAKGKEATVGLNDILKSLSHQLKLLDENLSAWNNMMEIDLDVLCEYKVIMSLEMYHDYAHMMTNKELVLQGLVKDAKAALARINNQAGMIREEFRGLL